MLSISTITEALAELERLTGRKWTESELFDVVTAQGIELHAATPITSEVSIQTFVIGEGLKEKHRGPHGCMARLFPFHVAQLWINGETMTSHASGPDIKDEYRFLTEPVRVTRESVRIKSASLHEIKARWDKAQAVGASAPAPKVDAVMGIEKREVMAAFQGLKWDYDHWGKNLASPSNGLKACRVARGNKNESGLWNPVDIGLYLLDEGQPLKKLDAAFVGLRDWTAEWQNKTELER